jgi:hypothetical protein
VVKTGNSTSATSVTSGTHYFFVVKARNGVGYRAASNEAAATAN